MTSSSVLDTPIGRLALTATDVGLSRVFHGGPAGDVAPFVGSPASAAHLQAAEQALGRFFAGSFEECRALAIDPAGTPFQVEVWKALRSIPAGTTLSYQALADQIGRSRAVRAVGLANGRNPVPIVVPCHRVIGANGTLTGFGLGVDVKAWLLVHEGAAAPFPRVVTAATRVARAHPSQPSLL